MKKILLTTLPLFVAIIGIHAQTNVLDAGSGIPKEAKGWPSGSPSFATSSVVGLSVGTGSITTFVWNDQDGDGIQDAEESGLAGIRVRLRNSSGKTIETLYTDANGNAVFSNVPAGINLNMDYQLSAGGVFSAKDQGSDDGLDSDVDPATMKTPDFSIMDGEHKTNMDCGIMPPGTVTSFVWNDLDADGIQDAGEPGLAGLTVRLRNSAGSVLQTQTTNASGFAVFTGVTPGLDLFLNYVRPNVTWSISPRDQGGNDAIDSDAGLENPFRTDLFRLTQSGQDFTAMDCGMYDINADTDGDGIPDYLDKYVFDNTNNGKAAILSRVWDDLDGDGLQDNKEPGVGGVQVRLRNSSGSVLQARNTHPHAGLVAFFDITPNAMVRLDVTRPSGTVFTLPNVGTNDAIDSDIESGGSQTVNFPAIGVVTNQDAGVDLPGTVTTFVWDDQDGDGIQDAGEPGLSGRTVSLRNASGSQLQAATTDANGIAVFTNVPTGVNLHLRYTVPAGNTITIANQGTDDALDSDAGKVNPFRTADFMLTRGSQSYTLMDCGMWAPGTVTTYVWDDQDADGIQDSGEPGLSGRTVSLRNASGSQLQAATTNASGIAVFTNVPTGINLHLRYSVPAGNTITIANQGTDDALDSDAGQVNPFRTADFSLTQGSQSYTLMDCGMWAPGTVTTYVWDDQDADGIQDSGEPGLSGRTVSLRNASGSQLQAATTNASGIAVFTNVPTGINLHLRYSVPAGNTITIANQGTDDALDSDAGQVSPFRTADFMLTSGSQNYTLMDCGMWAPGTITTFVWNDLNANGIQDAGEPGLSGRTVSLRNASGSQLQAATTNASGIATLTNVPTGISLHLRYTAPSGFTITPANQGSDDALDSDAGQVSPFRTADFSLTQGSQNYTLMDCGMYNPSVSPVIGGMMLTNAANTTPKSGINLLAAGKEGSVSSRDINVYPNPARSTVNVVMGLQENSTVNYSLMDVSGKVIRSGNWKLSAGVNTVSLDVMSLQGGVYILRVDDGKGIQSKKIMVNKR